MISFHTAQTSVRRTGIEWQYQIVVSRVFDEGEEELLDDEEESTYIFNYYSFFYLSFRISND
jgi:hypothetical protein